MSDFAKELEAVINRFSMENGSNTPDFILAKFLQSCLSAFDEASRSREKWYGKELKISGGIASEMACGIAARIWCDQDMKNIVMDVAAATRIAEIIDTVLNEN